MIELIKADYTYLYSDPRRSPLPWFEGIFIFAFIVFIMMSFISGDRNPENPVLVSDSELEAFSAMVVIFYMMYICISPIEFADKNVNHFLIPLPIITIWKSRIIAPVLLLITFYAVLASFIAIGQILVLAIPGFLSSISNLFEHPVFKEPWRLFAFVPLTYSTILLADKRTRVIGYLYIFTIGIICAMQDYFFASSVSSAYSHFASRNVSISEYIFSPLGIIFQTGAFILIDYLLFVTEKSHLERYHPGRWMVPPS